MTKHFTKASLVGALVAFCVFSSTATAVPPDWCRSTLDETGQAYCGFDRLSSLEISEAGGLGRIELHGKVGAVLQRDEGTVALLDLKDPNRPKKVGEYADGIEDSFDGDLAFSDDGNWLFYARQTHQFSKDGIHVLNVSDPTQPTLMNYHPTGGAYRIAYYNDGAAEWIVLLDATHGLVVYRFEPTTGQLVPVFVDALPALKVGGPASAGIYIEDKDPKLKTPLMYVTTGETGLQVYDFADPTSPSIVGTWSDVGLAEVEVRSTGRSRTIYAATEYWFDPTIQPEVVVLDASKLNKIKEARRLSFGGAADEAGRVQGMALDGGNLLIAHSSLGLVRFLDGGNAGVFGVARPIGARNEGAGVMGAPYAMDIEAARGRSYLTDAATGALTTLRYQVPGSY